MTKRKILGLSIILLSLAWLGSAYPKDDPKQGFIGNTLINIEIADTERERVKGLSDRTDLAENAGLFFVFETPSRYGFWMKDMNFAIDIAWLDANKKIIHIEKEVLPETYPKVFYPALDALYVLEVNSGFFEKNKIEIGQTLEMKGF